MKLSRKALTFIVIALFLLVIVACRQDLPDDEYVGNTQITSEDGYVPDAHAEQTYNRYVGDAQITSEDGYVPDVRTEQAYNRMENIPHGYLAMQHIIYMDNNLYRRPSFTYRELDTAMWIVSTLLDMGFDENAIEMQTFSFADVKGRLGGPYYLFFERSIMLDSFADRTPRHYSQNVILTIPGQSERVIVLGAHYDTQGGGRGHGANDNASGVGLLLENAQRMMYADNYYTLVYVFFGAEEMAMGLLGSYHYFNTLSQAERDNIVFMFNADVLFEGPCLTYVAGISDDGRRIDNDLTLSWDALFQELYNVHGITLIPYPYGMYAWNTDHIIFFEGGITVLYFVGIYRDDYGMFTRRFMDTPYDNLEHIRANSPLGMVEYNIQAFSHALESVLLDAFTRYSE